MEAVPYNNSKYFKKQRIAAPAVINTLPATETVPANIGRFSTNNETTQDVIKSELNGNSEPVTASIVPGSEHDEPPIVIKSEPEPPVGPQQTVCGQESREQEFGAREERLVKQYNSVRSWRLTGLGKDISTGTKSHYRRLAFL